MAVNHSEMKTFTYQGHPVYYRTVGEGRPLVILHGWGSNSKVMYPLASKLSALRCSYIPDLPGFGKSPQPPTAWAIDDYADMIQRFIVEHIKQPVDLLVHSFGGRIALKLCTRDFSKEWIDKVLITAGAGMRPRRSWQYYFKKYLAKTLKTPVTWLPGAVRNKALKKLRSTALWKKLGSSDYQKLDGTMREIFVKTVTEHLDELLPDVPHDTLLIWGETDSATPLYQAERMEEGIPHAALVTIKNAGHYAFLDQPAHFARIARAFFENDED